MWILGSTHIQPFVRSTEKYIEQSVVVSDGWCPRASGIVLVLVPPGLVYLVVNLTDIVPVDHIFRFQYLHAHKVEI